MQFSSTGPAGHKIWGVIEAFAAFLAIVVIIYTIKDAVFLIISLLFLLVYAIARVYGK